MYIISVRPSGIRVEARSKGSRLTGPVETAIRLNQTLPAWCVNEAAPDGLNPRETTMNSTSEGSVGPQNVTFPKP